MDSLNKKASEYIEKVIGINKTLGREHEDYLFITTESVTSIHAVDMFLIRACENIGIPKRNTHKIRKTYASRLYKNGVSM